MCGLGKDGAVLTLWTRQGPVSTAGATVSRSERGETIGESGKRGRRAGGKGELGCVISLDSALIFVDWPEPETI